MLFSLALLLQNYYSFIIIINFIIESCLVAMLPPTEYIFNFWTSPRGHIFITCKLNCKKRELSLHLNTSSSLSCSPKEWLGQVVLNNHRRAHIYIIIIIQQLSRHSKQAEQRASIITRGHFESTPPVSEAGRGVYDEPWVWHWPGRFLWP